MKPDSNRVKELFLEALQHKALDERNAFLAETCQNSPELREEVESLLRASEQAGDFLSQAITLTPPGFELEPPGTMIGRYKLLEKIGEGGFGVVYLAEQQEPMHRRVAVKIIKPGMDTCEVIARFEAERSVLALMDHPNIARVLDGGTTSTGRPYFVMEWVRGTPITDYCDQHNLPASMRLEIFVKVCQAVQYAHQKGIIHRDIKPSNILVTLQDGDPVPKVIDFGIAKALGQQPNEKSLLTSLRQMMGTPAYMSPEQAEMNSSDTDTRSDVYSLGALLYELLSGVPPFDGQQLAQSAVEEIRRTIRETEPPKPSARLRMLGQNLTEVARRRQTEPAELIRLLRGDLDWIVMKCLEKDRNRRYETAGGLAGDIQRHLNDEPVTAAAPSLSYRWTKFARRHRVALISSAGFALVLVIASVVSTWQAVVATRAKKREQVEANRSRQVAEFLQEMLQGVQPSVALGRDTTMLREILDKATERVGKDLGNQPEIQASLCEIIGQTYSQIGDYTRAEAMSRKAVGLEKQIHAPEHPTVATALGNLAAVLIQQNKLREAEQILREALAMRKRLQGENHIELAGVLNNLSIVLLLQGQLLEAERLQKQSLGIQKRVYGEEHAEVAESLNNLAAILKEQGKLQQSEALQRSVLAMQRKLLGKEHPAIARSLYGLALVLEAQDKLTESEGLHREALAMREKLLGPQHDDVADSLNGLGIVLQKQHRPDEAEALCREAVARQRKKLGDMHLKVAAALNSLAIILRQRGKLTEAEAFCGEALATKQKILGVEHPSVADTLNNLGVILREQRKLGEAETAHREALAMHRKVGQRDRGIADSLSGLAAVLHDQGKLTEAETAYRQVLDIQKLCFGDAHPSIAGTLNNLGTILEDQRKPKEAIALYGESVAMLKQLLGATNSELALPLNNLAKAERDQGDLPQAEGLYREAWAMRKSLPPQADLIMADSIDGLAGVLVRERKSDQAEPLARECLAIRTEALGEEDPIVVGSLHNLMVLLIDEHKEAEYQTVRTALTFARLGLAPKKRQEVGLEKSIEIISNAIATHSIVPDETLSTYLLARAFLLGERGRWPDAVKDLSEARRQVPSVLPSFGLGPMLMEIGDLEAYKDFRRRVLICFMGTQDPQTAAEAAAGMLLDAANTNGLSTARDLAELAVTQGQRDPRASFFQLAEALAHYRQGLFTSAADWANKSVVQSGTNYTTAVAAGTVLAMAQLQLNQAETARLSLRQAEELSETKLSKPEAVDLGDDWPECLLARCLLREGKRLIEQGTHTP